ncbi:YIP1 family protein [Profundibacter sp.]
MSATDDILQSYRHPRAVIRRHLNRGLREDYALYILLIACGIVFVSRWPELSRAAHLDPSNPLSARLWAAGLGWIFFAPLFFYALAWLSYLIARIIGGQGTPYGARLALFWSLLVVSPIWLLHGLVAGFIGKGPQLTAVGILLVGGFFWVWISSLIESQLRMKDD